MICVLCFSKMIDPNSPIFCKIQPKQGCVDDTFFEVGKLHKPGFGRDGFVCRTNFLHCFIQGNSGEKSRYFKVRLGTDAVNEDEKYFSKEMLVVEELSQEKAVNSITEKMCHVVL